jgi:hypothetical protein
MTNVANDSSSFGKETDSFKAQKHLYYGKILIIENYQGWDKPSSLLTEQNDNLYKITNKQAGSL